MQSAPITAKSLMLDFIRNAHGQLAKAPLQNRIALYFHRLEPRHRAEFAAAIGHFTARGYRCVDPLEFIAAAPDATVLMVSFDDNYRDWHEARPLFRELGLKATFYVNTQPFRDMATRDEIDAYLARLALPPGIDTLTRDELCALHADGHTIACHSHSHFMLSGLEPARWDAEIRRSKEQLQDLLGAPVDHFSWPYGMRRHFSLNLRRYCEQLGFATIANAIPGCQAIAGRDRYDIYRTAWHFGRSLDHNITNLRIDGRLYAALTGRSVIG